MTRDLIKNKLLESVTKKDKGLKSATLILKRTLYLASVLLQHTVAETN